MADGCGIYNERRQLPGDLCERGIRTFEPFTRNTLDLSAIPVVKELSHLPVIVDRVTGQGNSGAAMSRAVLLPVPTAMIEVHPRPQEALSDGLNL